MAIWKRKIRSIVSVAEGEKAKVQITSTFEEI